MESFLGQIAESLYAKYGDEISSLNIIFPSRRARLFFGDALAGVIGRPVWQPRYVSVDEVMEEISGLRSGDRIRLITELYKVYSHHHDETFDSFYFWGEVLLSDFDSIDKYLIDAEMLFVNIADLKALEDTDYLTPEQREVIARFWKSFGRETDYSEEQQRFMSVWNTLGDIYAEYREALAAEGLAYTGMAYREAAGRIKAGTVPAAARRRYVIAGFNALSECEKILFDHLAAVHDVEFFWDYDRYYLDNPEQEAGLFLRENLRRFPQQTELPYDYKGFSASKNITVVSAPSDSLQCKYIADFLRDVEARTGRKPDKDTAIVLTDENLLVPALHAIPSDVNKINVTMGYPLKLTLAYSFTERLISLQSRKRVRGGRTLYYHEDVHGLLRHPYVAESGWEAVGKLAGEIAARQQVYVDMTDTEGLVGKIFTPPVAGWGALAAYLKEVIAMVAAASVRTEENKTEYKQRLEFFSIISENIDKLRNSIGGCGIELSERIFASLLRRVLQSLRVPYEGEPLQGVQVMGILETRNLDFENVLLLSANDDTFPGNRASSPSYIPYNLRLAYGLPTPQHHEGVYAYYFYRLLQRAGRVDIAYSSKSDERSSGEQSRYIYQLEYESPHTVVRMELSVSVNVAPYEPIVVPKDGETLSKLIEFCIPGARRLSPTSFFNYIQCPLKFYFQSVARLRVADEVSEEVDAPMFGNLLHRAMELLYTSLRGDDAAGAKIAALVGDPRVELAVDAAIRDEYFKGDAVDAADYAGSLLLAKDIVVKYINNCILPFDAAQKGFTIEKLELRVESQFLFRPAASRYNTVYLGGVSDRVDRTDAGYRIVDYKTGPAKLEFKGLDALFSPEPADQNAAAFQTMLYAMMFNQKTGRDVQPALYYVREMNAPGYSPLLLDKEAGAPVTSYLIYKARFEEMLAHTLTEVFNPAIPFTQCADNKPCQWCDYNVVCKR